jgi:hypothetical protein
MSNPTDRVEIITSVQRRRRWTAAEKVRIVEETFEPGMMVSLVARRHGVCPEPACANQAKIQGKTGATVPTEVSESIRGCRDTNYVMTDGYLAGLRWTLREISAFEFART